MTGPVFETLDDVSYGEAEQVSPMIRRVIAENPSKFTYHGTGTYIVGHGDIVVIDPGPDLTSHRDALWRVVRSERVRAILVTHCHSDHSPLSAWLAAETGGLYGYVADATELPALGKSIASATCGGYTEFTATFPEPKESGERQWGSVRLKGTPIRVPFTFTVP